MRDRATRSGRQYAAIPNEMLRDKSLPADARLVLAILMTYSDDWTFRRDHLMEVTGYGRDRFQSAMRALTDAGYVDLVPIRGQGGHLEGTTWIIHDDPTESLKTRSSAESLKNRQPVEPTAGESAPIRKTKDQEDQKERIPQTPNGAGDDLFSAKDLPTKKTADEAFERFWKAYPPGRKTDKPKARLAWDQIVTGRRKGIPKTEPETIIAGAVRYAGSDPDPQFVPLPTTWLNGARWDAIDAPPSTPRPTGGHRLRPNWGEVVR